MLNFISYKKQFKMGPELFFLLIFIVLLEYFNVLLFTESILFVVYFFLHVLKLRFVDLL